MDHAKLAKTAQRLIQKHGREITLCQRATSAPDFEKPWRGSISESIENPADPLSTQTLALKGVFIDAQGGDASPGQEFSRLGLTTDGKLKFLVAALDLGSQDPLSFQQILDAGQVWRVTLCKVLAPGSTTILHIFEVER